MPALLVPNIARTKSQTTARIVEILEQAKSQGAVPEPARFAPFPVAGFAGYSHDWGFPRYNPYPHLHEGTDIFADAGTPVISTGPGVVAGFGDTAVGGLSVWIALDDGAGLYYTHLSGFAPGLAGGQRVEPGTVLGYVGNSGNAANTAPHVHFEWHPSTTGQGPGAASLPGGLARTTNPAADPKAMLDMWLVQAEQSAALYLAEVLQQFEGIKTEVHFARKVNDLFVVEETERAPDLLMMSTHQPEVGALGLAQQAAADARLVMPGSISQRTSEEQRLNAVRQVYQAHRFKLIDFTGLTIPGDPAFANSVS